MCSFVGAGAAGQVADQRQQGLCSCREWSPVPNKCRKCTSTPKSASGVPGIRWHKQSLTLVSRAPRRAAASLPVCSLESQFAQRSSGMGERLPHKPSRVMTKKPSLDSLLRSAKFPGLVVLTTAAGVGDVCKAAVSLFKRFT